MTQPVFRFAPSPNGKLHLGHALSALLNHDMAKSSGGRFLLRIEDIDTQRCRQEFIEAALDDLHWLGVEWEDPVRRQSLHFDKYRDTLEHLRAMDLIYPAFLTRSQIADSVRQFESNGAKWQRDPDGVPLYPGNERHWSRAEQRQALASGKPFTWRLDMQAARSRIKTRLTWTETDSHNFSEIQAHPEAWGDVVLARKDIPTSYHLAVVTDDALQGVTHVVRGMDLYHATSIHRLLQNLLGLPEPKYRHHRLVMGEHGIKLAKSLGSPTLAQVRRTGIQPREIRAMLGLESLD